MKNIFVAILLALSLSACSTMLNSTQADVDEYHVKVKANGGAFGVAPLGL